VIAENLASAQAAPLHCRAPLAWPLDRRRLRPAGSLAAPRCPELAHDCRKSLGLWQLRSAGTALDGLRCASRRRPLPHRPTSTCCGCRPVGLQAARSAGALDRN